MAWDTPTTNTDGSPLTDLGGYKLYYGAASGIYDHSIDVHILTKSSICSEGNRPFIPIQIVHPLKQTPGSY